MSKKLRKIKPKKKSNWKIILIVLIILIILGVGGYFGYNYYTSLHTKKKVTIKVLDSIDSYGYSISDRDSELYKEEYEKLKKILNEEVINDKDYAEEVAKMFIIDLYTISTKVNKYDVGGREFFYNTKVDMYDLKVMDTMYANLQDDTYGDRKQELPIVKSIIVKDTTEDVYKFIEDIAVNEANDTRACREGFEVSSNDRSKCVKDVDKVYVINLEWEYSKDMGYDKVGSVVVAKEDGNRWSVVEYQPKLDAFK